MRDIKEAKKRFIGNIGTNILLVFLNSVIAIWLTPYLIRNLGVEAYGLIPLALSVVMYFAVFSASIANAVSRYVTIHLSKGQIEESNIYFNSSFNMLIMLCGILSIPFVIIAILFPKLFHVPAGFKADSSWLFVYVVISFLLATITGPFIVSTFVRHRFDIANSVRIIGQLIRVAVLVLCFKYMSPSLSHFGISYCSMSLFVLVCFILITKWLTPELKVRLQNYEWTKIREMGQMSTWITINQAGIFLYLGSSFVVINIFLGAEQGGRYAPIAQWITLLGVLATTISSVFTPIVYEYIAQGRKDVLTVQICRSVKFMGLIMGFPVGILCGLSTPILKRWLGESFIDLSPLVWLLIGPLVVAFAIRPVASIYRGLDRVKVPALVTLLGGLLNVLLSIVLVRYTNLGIYGVALSLGICLGGKSLFFTPIYAAIIIAQPKTLFIKEFLPGSLMAGFVWLFTFLFSRTYELATIPRLSMTSIFVFVLYAIFAYKIIMNKEDRSLLSSLLWMRR